MHEILGLALVLALGVSAQWFSWRFHIPSILMLLLVGFSAGLSGIIDPDELFGDLLIPIVSLSVGIILFEGGLDLRFSELGKSGSIVRNLVSIGAVTSWILVAILSYFIFGLPVPIAILFGAILIVTGPTVIIPLLRHLRLSVKAGPSGTILKWEGLVIDPIGAIVATLVYEAIFAGGAGDIAVLAFVGVLKAAFVGVSFGILSSLFLIYAMKRYWVPDYLQNPLILTAVVVMFALSDVAQSESGLVTVTIMGAVMANQQSVRIKPIVEFKEALRVLLISSLFIVLPARIDFATIWSLGPEALFFLLALIVVVRPISVFVSTQGSELSLKEKVFISFMAPRGIVAASVASVFSIHLAEHNYPDADKLVSLTFLVIVGTVVFYSLITPLIARGLKFLQKNPQGVMIIGAHEWAREIASAINGLGLKVLLVDSNRENIAASRKRGLVSYYSNIFSDHLVDDLVLDGVGRLMALTPNDEVNTLASMHFVEDFSRAEVYQLAIQGSGASKTQGSLKELSSRQLFDEDITFSLLNYHFKQGATIESYEVKEETEVGILVEELSKESKVIPLFIFKKSGELQIFTTQLAPKNIPNGGKLIYIKCKSA